MTPSFKDLTQKEWDGHKGYRVKTCTSTMDLAWDLHGQGRFPEYAFILAESQTQGRGQFGREWVSDPGNLYVTLRLPDSAQTLDSLLSLAVALSVAGVLEDLHIPARIKWPNDIMVGYAKVGGILIEHKESGIMAGIGLNIAFAPENSAKKFFFHIKSGCLKESGVNLEPSQVWNLIFKKIRGHLPGIMKEPSKVAKDTEALLALKEDSVVVGDAGVLNGPARILGIDSQGRLIIETIKGIKSIDQGRILPRII